MNKQELRAFLEAASKDKPVTRYASPENPTKIRLATIKKVPNLRQQGWEEYLEQVKNGTYVPVSHEQYQKRG